MEIQSTASQEFENTLLEPPTGAITEDERTRLLELTRAEKMALEFTVYRVNKKGHMEIRRAFSRNQFQFIWSPVIGYYFTNYFHALAYSLQLKAKLRAENGTQMDLDQTP